MAPHLHECEQCGDEYLCTAAREDNGYGWLICVTVKESDPSYRMCVNCAEAELSTRYQAQRYSDLRHSDEQLGHIAANSSLGKDIAKKVRT